MVFNNRGNLLRHFLRIHRGLRRFICGLCGARYGQNQDLRRHLKAKHQVDMPVISCVDKKAVSEVKLLIEKQIYIHTLCMLFMWAPLG
jgi:hypothetical protein